MVQQPISGLGRFCLRFLDHTQLDTHTHTLVAAAPTYITQQTEFATAIAAVKRPQTYILIRTATEISLMCHYST